MSLDDEVTEIVEGYRAAEREESAAAGMRYPRAAPAATRKAADRIERAAAELLAALRAAPLAVRERVLAGMRARMLAAYSGAWKPGDALDGELSELAAVAGELAHRPAAKEKPGPRVDPLRLAFAVAIANAVERHGVKVTGHQTGNFALRLRDAWLRAKGNRLPDDMRPILRATLTVLRETARTR